MKTSFKHPNISAKAWKNRSQFDQARTFTT